MPEAPISDASATSSSFDELFANLEAELEASASASSAQDRNSQILPAFLDAAVLQDTERDDLSQSAAAAREEYDEETFQVDTDALLREFDGDTVFGEAMGRSATESLNTLQFSTSQMAAMDDELREELHKGIRKQSTRSAHERAWKAYCQWTHQTYQQNFPGIECDPRQLTVRTHLDVAHFLYYLGERQYADTSIRGFKSGISAIYLGMGCSDNSYCPPKGNDLASGNPTKCKEVADVITVLKKRNVSRGKVPQSVKALDREAMLRLYDHLHRPNQSSIESKRSIMHWCLYLWTWMCVMRGSEPCNIRLNDIDLVDPEYNYLVFRLRHRKNFQFGGCHPFYLWRNIIEPKLCPIHAFLQYFSIRAGNNADIELDQDTFLFCRMDRSARCQHDKQMDTGMITDMLQSDMQSIGYADYFRYKSHSFRRGGSQFWLMVMGWSFPVLCHWGGWEMSEAAQVLRYLYGEGDTIRSITTFTSPQYNYLRKTVPQMALEAFVEEYAEIYRDYGLNMDKDRAISEIASSMSKTFSVDGLMTLGQNTINPASAQRLLATG